MTIKGIIWDADGTLLDSMEIWEHAPDHYLETLGIEPEPNLGEILFEMSLEQGAKYLIDRYHLPVGVADVLEGIHCQIETFYRREVTLKPGAKELLAEAGYPDGEGFPAITYKYPSLQLDSDMAQALQAQWKTNLGIEVELQAEEQQVQVAERRTGDFQLARMRWTADFTDPFTFLSMYRSNDSYNDNKTNCPEYDELMAQSNEESDPTARFELLHQAESVLVNDYCFGVPVLNSSNIYLVSTDITNFEIDPSRNMIRTKYLVLGDSSSES